MCIFGSKRLDKRTFEHVADRLDAKPRKVVDETDFATSPTYRLCSLVHSIATFEPQKALEFSMKTSWSRRRLFSSFANLEYVCSKKFLELFLRSNQLFSNLENAFHVSLSFSSQEKFEGVRVNHKLFSLRVLSCSSLQKIEIFSFEIFLFVEQIICVFVSYIGWLLDPKGQGIQLIRTFGNLNLQTCIFPPTSWSLFFKRISDGFLFLRMCINTMFEAVLTALEISYADNVVGMLLIRTFLTWN